MVTSKIQDLGNLLEIDEILISALSSRWNYKSLVTENAETGFLCIDRPHLEDKKKKDILKELSEEVELEDLDEEGKEKLATLGNDNYLVRVKYVEEDYKRGDLDRIAPGTYLEVIRVHPIYMEDGLFGYTYPEGGLAVYVRSDLRGEALRRVIKHEVAHHAMRLGEEAARDLTGTHMHEFLPIFERSRYN